MSQADLFPTRPGDSSVNALRLRTLILLRWLAIGGQLSALALGPLLFGLWLPVGPGLAVIGVLLAVNLFAILAFPTARLLSEREALLALLFDISQLALLLSLTGGVNNPFAILILAPVTIAATALARTTAVVVGAAAIALITLMLWAHLPLRDQTGAVLELPPIFQFGSWAAIVIGVMFIGLYSRRVAAESRAMSQALLATQMALAREQKLTDLGGVVAAAAHELGTPLATIKLVSAELLDEVEEGPLAEDIRLIAEQTDRCRDILRSMGRAGKDDLYLRTAPLEAVVREAAEPHAARGRELRFTFDGNGAQPQILRRSEIVHGLRNLVQNAVDFAQGAVAVEGNWSIDAVRLCIRDDGPGYPVAVLGRIGEPFVRHRPAEDRQARPAYEGMGLGLFIAKTLLERTGASLRFANPPEGGAQVEVTWPRGRIEANRLESLGENRPF